MIIDKIFTKIFGQSSEQKWRESCWSSVCKQRYNDIFCTNLGTTSLRRMSIQRIVLQHNRKFQEPYMVWFQTLKWPDDDHPKLWLCWSLLCENGLKQTFIEHDEHKTFWEWFYRIELRKTIIIFKKILIIIFEIDEQKDNRILKS